MKSYTQDIPIHEVREHILKKIHENLILPSDYSTIEESVIRATVPKCPCGKSPLRCPKPDNCEMENL